MVGGVAGAHGWTVLPSGSPVQGLPHTAATGTGRAPEGDPRTGRDQERPVLSRNSSTRKTAPTESAARRTGQRLVELISTPVQLAEGMARIGASIGAARVHPGAPDPRRPPGRPGHVRGQGGRQEPGAVLLPRAVPARRAGGGRGGAAGGHRRRRAVLTYQPVLSAADARCTAVEALVRWRTVPRAGRARCVPRAGGGDRRDHRAGRAGAPAACADAVTWPGVAVHVNASPPSWPTRTSSTWSGRR